MKTHFILQFDNNETLEQMEEALDELASDGWSVISSMAAMNSEDAPIIWYTLKKNTKSRKR